MTSSPGLPPLWGLYSCFCSFVDLVFVLVRGCWLICSGILLCCPDWSWIPGLKWSSCLSSAETIGMCPCAWFSISGFGGISIHEDDLSTLSLSVSWLPQLPVPMVKPWSFHPHAFRILIGHSIPCLSPPIQHGTSYFYSSNCLSSPNLRAIDCSTFSLSVTWFIFSPSCVFYL